MKPHQKTLLFLSTLFLILSFTSAHALTTFCSYSNISFISACPSGWVAQNLTSSGLGCLQINGSVANITGTGTQYQITKFLTNSTLGDSIMSDNGTVVVINGKQEIRASNSIPTATTSGILNIFATDNQAIDIGGSITLGGYNDNLSQGLRMFASIEGRKSTSSNNSSSGYFRIKTNSAGTLSERLRITSVGDVGIGTSTPSQKLDVIGNINVSGIIYHANSTTDVYFNGCSRIANETGVFDIC